jgi:hypothetical protein
MSKPLVVSIPHSLGREEAVRRLKSGFGSVPATFQQLLAVQEEVWTGDNLRFRISALGQVASGAIDVADDHVRLTIVLPWLLAKFAEKIQSLVGNQTKLMLEKR